MRLIDADKLAEGIYRAWTLWEKKGEDCYLFAEVITPMLIGQPTVEAEPIKHGRWVDHQYKEFPIGRYECSVCGAKHDMEWDYCPNCGAKMDVNQIVNQTVNQVSTKL